MRPQPRKTVQIVGAAPSLLDCPVIEGAERWLFNASHVADGGRPYTRVFNLHHKAMILGLQPKAWQWYQEQDKPVYLLETDPEIPHSIAFPLITLMTYFASDQHGSGVEEEACFGCSLDFLIAFALWEGFEHIDLIGIECRSEEEYREQRSSVMYWMGYARGLGRTITTTRSSGLATVAAIYGYNLPTGSPSPPGQPKAIWLHGHPHSTWPIPETFKDPILINGAFEHP